MRRNVNSDSQEDIASEGHRPVVPSSATDGHNARALVVQAHLYVLGSAPGNRIQVALAKDGAKSIRMTAQVIIELAIPCRVAEYSTVHLEDLARGPALQVGDLFELLHK